GVGRRRRDVRRERNLPQHRQHHLDNGLPPRLARPEGQRALGYEPHLPAARHDGRSWPVVHFTFPLTAPASPGPYPVQWQLVHEGVEWFGARSPDAAVNVTPPPVEYHVNLRTDGRF